MAKRRRNQDETFETPKPNARHITRKTFRAALVCGIFEETLGLDARLDRVLDTRTYT